MWSRRSPQRDQSPRLWDRRASLLARPTISVGAAAALLGVVSGLIAVELVRSGQDRFLVSVGELEDLWLWYDRPFRILREPVPNMWWPLDRSVFVHSEIDLYSTYVGCSREVANLIVSSPALESTSVDAGFPIAGT